MNLTTYLERIGIAERPEPTAEALRALHRAHLLSIPFEKLGIRLDQAQSSHRPQGGS